MRLVASPRRDPNRAPGEPAGTGVGWAGGVGCGLKVKVNETVRGDPRERRAALADLVEVVIFDTGVPNRSTRASTPPAK